MAATTTHGPKDTAATDQQSVSVQIFMRREGDHWSAVAPDFTIAGRGDTPDEALANVAQLLADYLVVSLREGVSVEDAKRRPPLAWRIRHHARQTLARLRNEGSVERRQIPISSRPVAC